MNQPMPMPPAQPPAGPTPQGHATAGAMSNPQGADPAPYLRANAMQAGVPALSLPPSLWGAAPPEKLLDVIKQAKWMLLAYWLLLVSGYVVLLGIVVAYGGGGGGLGMLLLAMLASAAGVAVGHLLGALRLRPWIGWVISIGGTIVVSIPLAAVPALLIMAIAFLWSLTCGQLAMQRRNALSAIWIPVVCWAGCIITLLDKNLSTWMAGHKERIWDALPLLLLFVMIVEIFLFFAGQEHYHAQVWQAHAGTSAGRLTRHQGAARLTGRGLFALVGGAAVVCAAVALVAPYLWRTGPAKHDGDAPSSGQQQQDEPREQPRNHGPDFDGDALQRAVERAAREAEREAKQALPFLPLMLLSRPLRRLALLRHLRKPVYKLAPSERARNLWRYALIALGDARAEPRNGESLSDAVARLDAERTRAGQPPTRGLAELADGYQRVRHGLGIPPGALDDLGAQAERAYDSVREPLDPWRRITSWWRKIEV